MRKLVFVVVALFALFAFIQAYTSVRANGIPPQTQSAIDIHSNR